MIRTVEDTEADGGTPTPMSSAPVSPTLVNVDELEVSLYDLLINEKWSAAISFIKHNKSHLGRDMENYFEMEDDVVLLLNIYCKRLVQEKADCYVITNQDADLGDVFGRLFQVSAAISDLEGIIKEKEQSDASITSQSKE